MPEITLDVGNGTFRKIKAMSILMGTTDVEPVIVGHLDRVVSGIVADLLGIPTHNQSRDPAMEISKIQQPEVTLSEEEIEEEPVHTAPTHVLSAKSLEEDESVEDPEHEAVSSSDDDTTFEELFGDNVGDRLSSEDIDEDDDGADDNPFEDTINLEEEKLPPRRVGVKKLPKGVRARVGEYNGNNPVNPERD